LALREGKVALVTGGGSGIGREIALIYAAEGAKVIVADINAWSEAETDSMISKKAGRCSRNTEERGPRVRDRGRREDRGATINNR
jgi:NAD(P)-dependent dehydrogenase (short-subunit alcohol dehydrogenase family)